MSRPPVVALVGRPNVGKSTLFNRLAGRRRALVSDRPGVTRDRLEALRQRPEGAVTLVDTGGWEVQGALGASLREQLDRAVEDAQVVILVVDRRAGLTAEDAAVAAYLRGARRPWLVAANKSDVPAHDHQVGEFWRLGPEEVVPVSAEHGRGIDGLWGAVDARVEAVPAADEAAGAAVAAQRDQACDTGPLRVALVGRPNVGKSSLANRMVGGARLIADARAGTTRDAVEVALTTEAGAWVLVDTPGVRRRPTPDALEALMVGASRTAMATAHVVVVVLDGSVPAAIQDRRMLAHAEAAGRALVVVVNKADRVEGPARRAWEAQATAAAAWAWAPRLWLSAATGEGCGRLGAVVAGAAAQWRRHLGTGVLNRTIAALVRGHQPPADGPRRPHIYYASQPEVAPPTFVFSARAPDAISPAYARYLQAGIRRAHGFAGTPLWLKFRGR